MYEIDRYEAERIARDEARSVADEVRREIGYDIDRLKDDLERAERRLADRISALAEEVYTRGG